jgi:hypothetical protein
MIEDVMMCGLKMWNSDKCNNIKPHGLLLNMVVSKSCDEPTITMPKIAWELDCPRVTSRDDCEWCGRTW